MPRKWYPNSTEPRFAQIKVKRSCFSSALWFLTGDDGVSTNKPVELCWVHSGCYSKGLLTELSPQTKTSHNYRFSACETRIQIPQSGCCDRCRPHGHAQAAPINIFNSLTGFWDSTSPSFVKWSPKVCFSIFPAKHFKFYLPQRWKWSKDMQKRTSGVVGSSAGCLHLHVTVEEVISITIGCLKVMTLPEFSKNLCTERLEGTKRAGTE